MSVAPLECRSTACGASASAGVRKGEGSLFLNLARLHGDSRDVEAEVLSYLNRIELSGIEPPRDSIERMDQCAISRILPVCAEASSLAGTLEPHKVPSSMANHGVEDQGGKILDHRPVVSDWRLERVQPVRQNASFPQKNGMLLHACALLDVIGTATDPKSDSLTSGRTTGTAMHGSNSDPSVTGAISGSVRSDCSSEKPVASGWLAGVARWILVRWREER